MCELVDSGGSTLKRIYEEPSKGREHVMLNEQLRQVGQGRLDALAIQALA
jgi:hypothetical protein